MKHRISTLAAVAFVAACGVDSPTQPAADLEIPAPSFSHVVSHGAGWSASGPGAVAVVSNGTSSDPEMTYSLSGSAVWSTQTWSFSSSASTGGSVTLGYTYSGFHAFFQVRVFARAFVTRGGNTTYASLVSAGPVNCCSAPSNGFNYSGDHTFNLQAGDVFGFEFGGSNGDSDTRLLGTFTVAYPVPQIFTSDPAAMDAWGPIIQLPMYPSWPAQACKVTPEVGLDDPRWGAPHAAYAVGPASFESWTPWSGFSAPWINAWPSLFASAAPGAQNGSNTQSWSKFASTVSGQGTHVVQFLADNCSWIYLDGILIGVQGVDWNTNPAVDGRYSLTLSGTHTLSFIVFDGGGQAGGKFRLETLQSYVDGGGDPGDVNPPLPTDDTPPVITPNVTGTLNGDWYTSDVNVSWTVTDAESATSSTSGCDATTVDYDTDGVIFTCTATSEGGTASESVTIKRDATAPVVTASESGTMGDNDWYTSDVAVSFEVSEPTSPLSTSGCDAVTVSTDTDGITFICDATSAGGTASASVTVKRDATDPVIAFSGNEGAYTVDQSVAITCSATDTMSGIASEDCPGASGDAYTFGVGTTTLSASATDNAGNSSALSTSFAVSVTSGSLCTLVQRWVSQRGVQNSLCQQLNNRAYGAFINHVRSQSGKFVPADKAAILIALAQQL